MDDLQFDTISFLSDYGRSDEFVGVVHSVIRSIAPAVTVVDITHEITPFDVRAGGLALARSANYLVPGVVLAVVDPGVGTERRPVAIEVGGGQSYLIGPDNGLLAPAVAMVGGASGAWVLDNTDLHLPAPGPTFDGRDVFAPVAARLCTGVPAAELGTAIDPAQLFPGVLPVSEERDGGLEAEILWVDRFGNAQLNVDPSQLVDWPPTVEVTVGDRSRVASRVVAFGETPAGSIGLIVDSYGLVALVCNQGSAADVLAVGEGDAVTLSPVSGRQPSVTVPVDLAPTRNRPEETPR